MVLNFSLGNVYGIDSFFEFLIIIVSLIIAYSGYRIYKIIGDKKYKIFSLGFLTLSLSFIFKILSNLTIFYKVRVNYVGLSLMGLMQWKYMELFNFVSFIFYKIFHIVGFLILFFVITHTEKKEKILTMLYLGIIAVLFSIYFNFIFDLTLVVLLFFLTMHFYQNYEKQKSKNSFLVFFAFLLMLVSHCFFIFSDISMIFYLIGEILLLISFLNLLINQFRSGKKTEKNRNTKRIKQIA
ncbi:MAG: hypothetical protein PHF67_05280 [Candidatus Nanoarchaeia archaeon]|nr:hypothetical protein [Candidatus Nanoarchaeia archaeon]